MHDWYDDRYDPYPSPYAEPPIDLADRVTHLVYVGGRLVETRHEHARDTAWEQYVERPAPPPPPPEPPQHVRVLDWLTYLCGGAASVDALDAEPLGDETTDLPTDFPDERSRQWVETTATLLDVVADRWFDPETSVALRHALLALWVEDPTRVTRPKSAAHLAGGLVWAVGKANGLFQPTGPRRIGTVQDTLGLSGGLSTAGNEVAAALRGFRGQPWSGRPTGVPDLLPLGRADVLLGATREQLVRLRDRARAAAD